VNRSVSAEKEVRAALICHEFEYGGNVNGGHIDDDLIWLIVLNFSTSRVFITVGDVPISYLLTSDKPARFADIAALNCVKTGLD